MRMRMRILEGRMIEGRKILGRERTAGSEWMETGRETGEVLSLQELPWVGYLRSGCPRG